MRINFDFSDMEAFLAVRETGSFRMASERLNLSQPAVSRRIQKLEAALGSVLFERTTRAVKPTLAAKRFQARAEAILEEVRETIRTMNDESVAFAHQRSAIMTVATIPTVVGSLLLPALRAFRRQGFLSRVRLLDHSANEVAESVAQGEADFGICSIPTLEPGTDFEALFEDAIMLVVHRDHPLARPDRVRWREIADEALILPARGTGNRMLIDEALARASRPLIWTYEVGRTATALELVAERAGIALLPHSAAVSLAGKGLAFRPMTAPEITRPVGLLARAGEKDTDAVSAFKDVLRDVSSRQGTPAP